jgi:DNA-binding NtrC family response regulator
LTGEATLEVAAQVIGEGLLYRFLSKPVSPQELADTIRRALQLQKLNAERRPR